MPETAPLVKEHAAWCVRRHKRGACSEKRGHWDRGSNTWISDLTDHDRKTMAEALEKWRDGESITDVMDWVRLSGDTLQKVENTAILTWNMTQKRLAGMGKSWPIKDS